MRTFCREVSALLEREGCETRIIAVHAGRSEILVDGYVRGNITVAGKDHLDVGIDFPEDDVDFVKGLVMQIAEE